MQWISLPPKGGGLIQMDISGHPPIPTCSHAFFINGSYFLYFRVINVQGHFEALNSVFGARNYQIIIKVRV
jgi:hypothetical protein